MKLHGTRLRRPFVTTFLVTTSTLAVTNDFAIRSAIARRVRQILSIIG